MQARNLEEIGLSKNEAKVYFALLEFDQATATPLIRKAGIPYSKIYPTLDKLIKKGLVSFVIKNNVKNFQASSPRNILEFIKEKEERLKEQKINVEKLIPLIEMKKKNENQKQEAIVYEGIDGIKVAFNQILLLTNPNRPYFVFTLGEELARSELKHFFRDYHKKRVERKIKVELIASKKIRQIFAKHHQFQYMKVRYTSLSLPTGIFIFSDYVMTVVWGDKPTAFVIKSLPNAERYKLFFKEVWGKATS